MLAVLSLDSLWAGAAYLAREPKLAPADCLLLHPWDDALQSGKALGRRPVSAH